MQPVFKRSLPEESEKLSAIAVRSKGHWGYSQELLESWRKDLSISSDYIVAHTNRSIWLDKQIIGFFSIVQSPTPLLDNLWLLPERIGQGIGKQAIREIISCARLLDIPALEIISDPYAEGFYLHHGAIRIGEHPSVPQDRMLPKLQLPIL